MSINLSPQHLDFVNHQIAGGAFGSADEVVHHALELFCRQQNKRTDCTPLESGELEGEALEQHVVELLSNEGGFPDYPPEIDARMQQQREVLRAEIQEAICELDAGQGIRVKSSELEAYFESVAIRARASMASPAGASS